ncbi:MAG: SRPBCC domain-containing protein [Ginsengibacter sp.]
MRFILITLTSIVIMSFQKNSLRIKETIQTKNTPMDNKDFTATIIVDQSPEKAFDDIKNFRAWWSEDIEGSTGQINETFFYHYKDVHLCKLKLIEMEPNKRLVYLVVDNEFNFVKDKTEWVNTRLIFEISNEGDKTKIKFTHEGLVPAYECYNVCEDAWTSYIQGSLQSLITTGKGKPNPKEGGLNEELVKKWGLPNK